MASREAATGLDLRLPVTTSSRDSLGFGPERDLSGPKRRCSGRSVNHRRSGRSRCGHRLPSHDRRVSEGWGTRRLSAVGVASVEDEFDAWLGRARYERRPDYQRGLRNYGSGLRNGFRPRRVQAAEGELEVEIPQVREAAETFALKLFPRDQVGADRAAQGVGCRRAGLPSVDGASILYVAQAAAIGTFKFSARPRWAFADAR
jgi:hypothetical protein